MDASDQIGRLVERVASLEGSTREAISNLKDDTRSIRSSLHESNNTMTGFMGQHLGLVKQLEIHIAGCDKRGARMEKAIWVGIAATLAILGFLLQPHFSAARSNGITAPAVIVQPTTPTPQPSKR